MGKDAAGRNRRYICLRADVPEYFTVDPLVEDDISQLARITDSDFEEWGDNHEAKDRAIIESIHKELAAIPLGGCCVYPGKFTIWCVKRI